MEFIKITYIYHDCFTVDTPEALLVFDFWKDPYQQGPLPVPLMEQDREKPVYVFVSHFHKDHYNPEIFDWADHFENIHYIVSKDVRKRMKHILNPASTYKGRKINASRVIAMTDEESYEDRLISVRSFPSTDVGNSYAVRIGGIDIFHAGDLNAWIWKDESTDQEVEEALTGYTNILKKIEAYRDHFTICFFPVDSRIGTDYFTGAKLFLEKIKVDTFFPMHYELGEDVDTIARLHRDAAAFSRYASLLCRQYVISAPYSAFVFSI